MNAARAFASSARVEAKAKATGGKKKKVVANPDAMPLTEATRILRVSLPVPIKQALHRSKRVPSTSRRSYLLGSAVVAYDWGVRGVQWPSQRCSHSHL